jgi:hypothetical protein
VTEDRPGRLGQRLRHRNQGQPGDRVTDERYRGVSAGGCQPRSTSEETAGRRLGMLI